MDAAITKLLCLNGAQMQLDFMMISTQLSRGSARFNWPLLLLSLNAATQAEDLSTLVRILSNQIICSPRRLADPTWAKCKSHGDTKVVRFLKTTLLVAMLVWIHPYKAYALITLEIRGTDVFKAGYCLEFNSLAMRAWWGRGPFAPRDISQIEGLIVLHATDLIDGGDNLDFVDFGAKKAQQDFFNLFDLRPTTDQEDPNSGAAEGILKTCSEVLQETVAVYKVSPNGYGRNRKAAAELDPRQRGLWEAFLDLVSGKK